MAIYRIMHKLIQVILLVVCMHKLSLHMVTVHPVVLVEGVGPGRLCQHNFKHNRLSILVRIMLE